MSGSWARGCDSLRAPCTFHANVVLRTGREKSRCASPAGGDGKWQGAVDEPGKQVLADDALPVPVSKSAASRPVADITSDGPSQQTDAGHVPLKSVGCGAKVVTCGCGLRAGGWVALLALVAPCAARSKEGSETVSLDKGPGGADPGRLEWRYSVEGRSDGALTGANVKQTLSKPNGRAFPRKASMPSPRFRSPSARCLSARVPFTCAGRHGRRHLQLLLRTSGLCRCQFVGCAGAHVAAPLDVGRTSCWRIPSCSNLIGIAGNKTPGRGPAAAVR